MLKIKDKVELEDIEKITDIVVDDDFIWVDKEETICIDGWTRIITVYAEDDEGNRLLDALYNLIQAGLVEKV